MTIAILEDVREAAMCRWVVIGVMVALSPVPAAYAQSRSEVIWTISGGGAGFGVGLWAGLSAFDDAVYSDRKVWTSAVVGAAAGAVAGYLIGRSRKDRTHPWTEPGTMHRSRQEATEWQLVEQVAQSVRFRSGTPNVLHDIGEDGPAPNYSRK